MVNQFNNATPKNGNDPEKIASSKYYDIDEMHNIEIPYKNKPVYLFHINACSCSKNFDTIAASETRITKNLSLLNSPRTLIIILLNSLQLRLVQAVPFFTLLTIYHVSVVMTYTSIRKMN